MFEAIVMLCAGLAGEPPCRAALLPGFEAADRAGCVAALEARPVAGA
ncbi:MBL fold metallo-hydrolase, partial [Yangia sp. PrR003]|nr:MBL fold metallo-hydrolase [Salipiger sp. PrR003]